MSMNFKIESNFLDITNYPCVARHFEEMSSKGWLINKIVGANIFIYKKIEAERLEFSISPYEIETVFTRKTKGELEEYNFNFRSFIFTYNIFFIYQHIS